MSQNTTEISQTFPASVLKTKILSLNEKLAIKTEIMPILILHRMASSVTFMESNESNPKSTLSMYDKAHGNYGNCLQDAIDNYNNIRSDYIKHPDLKVEIYIELRRDTFTLNEAKDELHNLGAHRFFKSKSAEYFLQTLTSKRDYNFAPTPVSHTFFKVKLFSSYEQSECPTFDDLKKRAIDIIESQYGISPSLSRNTPYSINDILMVK